MYDVKKCYDGSFKEHLKETTAISEVSVLILVQRVGFCYLS
jgi:hypothetical protein